MTRKVYEYYAKITKELIETIKVGDLIKVNEWKKPYCVKGVSEHYFIMTAFYFGKPLYLIFEKHPQKEISNNLPVFYVGRSTAHIDKLFGYPTFDEFEDETFSVNYLAVLETYGENVSCSFDTVVPVQNICIKRS